ncbi:efflux RND transporter periplasmic adaptor subunit [Marinomonas pollencensis]|uniref:Multidrug efflux system membrane fusion protein n=1 Tax=Marinomonas pollencensis TaxID=491954 RepID=A0A3E0DNZ4_9GAMM|nr:efflux RND transporter periplasmic adaptor subunit [Marinomonas pollencensis]REG83869.1 multidrug efflux system membrane fusion protein [Marinomonas pollencensis]
MTTRSGKTSRLFLLLLAVLVIAGGWFGWHYISAEGPSQSGPGAHKGERQRPPGGGPGGPGGRRRFNPNQVTAVYADKASQADVAVFLDALGTVKANTSVTVTSRITGEMQKVFFREGQYVTAGQLLAQIDDRSYQATLAQYQGELAQNAALLKSAQATLTRYQQLAKEDSISIQAVQEQAATVGQYQGIVATDKAQIDAAKLDIEYAKIHSPISGYTGLLDVDQGNLVTADSTSIVTVTQINPITVTFNIPQAQLQPVLQGLRKKQLFEVTVFNQTGEQELAQGELTNISNSVDSDTGTVKLKAQFNNDNEILYPNQFVNVRMKVAQLTNAVVIPKAALQRNDEGDFVFIIAADNKVHKQTITTGPVDGEDRIVALTGVTAGDQLVTTGIDNLIEGSKVRVIKQRSHSESGNHNQQSKARMIQQRNNSEQRKDHQ